VNYWPEEEFLRLDALADRGLQVLATFQRYLRSPQARRNAERRYAAKHCGSASPNGNVNGTKNENERNDPNDPNGSNVPNDP